MTDQPLLEVEELRTHFVTAKGRYRAVEGMSFQLRRGQVLGIVGESGCGKSVTALSLLRLLPMPPAEIVGGTVRFDGMDLLALSDTEMRDVRGRDMAMIFQEPMTSLNPCMTVGRQIDEMLERHQNLDRTARQDRILELLKMVRIPDAERNVNAYPHSLSGGMRQRVMIAMALACNPKVLIADEPTTALDVTIQAQILELMRELRERLGTAIIIITHDLGVIADIAESVVVMYAGRPVEQSPVEALFDEPAHPYTRGLLEAVPRPGQHARLAEIPGIVPSLLGPREGCAYAPRCPLADDRCRIETPAMRSLNDSHRVACWRPGEES